MPVWNLLFEVRVDKLPFVLSHIHHSSLLVISPEFYIPDYTISINSIEDIPRIEASPMPEEGFDQVVIAVGLDKQFVVTAREVDGQDFAISVATLPSNGILYVLDDAEVLTRVEAGNTLTAYATGVSFEKQSTLIYKPNKCSTLKPVGDSIEVIVTETEGELGSATVTIALVYDCADLHTTYLFKDPDELTYVVGYAFGGIGLAMCLIFAIFNLKYKNVPVVKFTSPKVLYFKLFTSSLSLSLLLFLFLSLFYLFLSVDLRLYYFSPPGEYPHHLRLCLGLRIRDVLQRSTHRRNLHCREDGLRI